MIDRRTVARLLARGKDGIVLEQNDGDLAHIATVATMVGYEIEHLSPLCELQQQIGRINYTIENTYVKFFWVNSYPNCTYRVLQL